MSGIDKNRRDKRGYADPDYKTHHEHGYVTLCRMRLAIPDDCCNQAISQLCAFCSPDRRTESASLCYGDFSPVTMVNAILNAILNAQLRRF